MRQRTKTSRRCSGGSSLLEVMLAVLVMSCTSMGFTVSQLWSSRQALAVGYREDAVWIADALAEVSRAPQRDDGALGEWQVRASSQLPRGEASVESSGSGVAGMARVLWSMPADRVLEWNEPADTCGTVATPGGIACATIAFAR